jgi:hypothetical protein
LRILGAIFLLVLVSIIRFSLFLLYLLTVLRYLV